MSNAKTIKVKIQFTVKVDVAQWAKEYDIEPDEVRADVKAHFENVDHEFARCPWCRHEGSYPVLRRSRRQRRGN